MRCNAIFAAQIQQPPLECASSALLRRRNRNAKIIRENGTCQLAEDTEHVKRDFQALHKVHAYARVPSRRVREPAAGESAREMLHLHRVPVQNEYVQRSAGEEHGARLVAFQEQYRPLGVFRAERRRRESNGNGAHQSNHIGHWRTIDLLRIANLLQRMNHRNTQEYREKDKHTLIHIYDAFQSCIDYAHEMPTQTDRETERLRDNDLD